MAMKLINTATVLPPLSLPKKVQFPRQTAIPRFAPVIDLRIAVSEKTCERFPLIQRLAHSPGRRIRNCLACTAGHGRSKWAPPSIPAREKLRQEPVISSSVSTLKMFQSKFDSMSAVLICVILISR
jgi:hypothetical protein